ncbi:MAG: hypothetical protein LBJ80_02075 [Rickettsiales bacterium]|jgi:hypothetical protein|nr:hypothetical protein [Rickettsiales bacterium]MDR1261188.1 hypothetical protein [Rickettsiales bacterium]
MVKLEKDITYELVDDKGELGELTEKDKEKVLKLAKKIEEGKGIAEKFKKSSYNTRKILTTKIVREHEGRKETFTLLYHAMLHGSEKAINDISEKAKEHKLFEQISNEKIITEYWSDQGKLICASYSTAKYENGVVSTRTLKAEFITKDTLLTTPAIETDTPTCENSKDSDNAEATNEKNEKDSTTALTETATQKLSILSDKTNTSPFTEIENQTETRYYSEPGKENTVNKKPLTKVPQQRQAIIAGGAGTALLVSSIASYALKMHIIAVVGGIVGLACMSFALYNVLKPSTKLEEVKDVECSRKSPEVAL